MIDFRASIVLRADRSRIHNLTFFTCFRPRVWQAYCSNCCPTSVGRQSIFYSSNFVSTNEPSSFAEAVREDVMANRDKSSRSNSDSFFFSCIYHRACSSSLGENFTQTVCDQTYQHLSHYSDGFMTVLFNFLTSHLAVLKLSFSVFFYRTRQAPVGFYGFELSSITRFWQFLVVIHLSDIISVENSSGETPN